MELKENKTRDLVVKKAVKKQPETPFTLKAIQFGFNTVGRVFPTKASKVALQLFRTPRLRARHKTIDEWIESAKVNDVQINGINIKTYEWGEGERTVLLAHGWESRGTALRAYIPSLLDGGFKIVAFDAPAHGDSDGKQTDLNSFGETVKFIIKQKKSIYGLIAHSFGGPASMYALARMNEDYSIPKVVFVACPSAISVPVKRAIKTLKLPRSIADKFIKTLENIIGLPLENITIPHFAKTIQIDEMLIVHDIDDAIVPIGSALANHKAFTQSRFFKTEGLGHSQILKDKQTIELITGFLLE